MYRIKRTFRQIKNLFRWIPIIWKQYDWDYRYSIDAFKFQLQKQAEFFESDKAHCMGAKERGQRIRTVLRLMDKVYNEDYGMEWQDQLKELYGEDVLNWSFEDTGRGDNSSYLKHEYDCWPNAEEVKSKSTELFFKSKEKQERAHKLLWALIEKDIRSWWD